MVVVGGDDFTVRGGAADASVGNKHGYGEMLAHELRIPIIRLVDGTGGGGSVRTFETMKRTYVPANPSFDVIVKVMAEVPVIAGCMGSVAGIGAARVAASHFSVMVRGTSQLFVAGPPVVKWGTGENLNKEELSGSEIHAHNSGAVDNEVESEDEALAQIRHYLSYLPQSVWQVPPYVKPEDKPDRREEELLSIVPRNRRQGYDARRILELVMDRDSWFEIAQYFGPSLITGFARLDGFPCGVMINDPYFIAGSLDAAASDKMVKFVDLCDSFHLPVVNFVDQPGFLIGREAEMQGTIRHGVRALYAVFQTVTPWVAVMVRKAFGVAGAGHGITTGLNLRYAWPSADWGSLPIEGGIEAAYKRDLAASADPEKLRRELEDKFNAVRSPVRTAEAFGIEEIIDPRDTRRLLCEWIHQAYEIIPTQLGIRTRTMRP
jgi:acetyl-CoA carboxylase carboxyltransferase component